MYNKCNDSLNSENNKEMLENIITVLKSKECCSAAPKKKKLTKMQLKQSIICITDHFTEFKSRHVHVPKMILWQYIFASVVTCIALI